MSEERKTVKVNAKIMWCFHNTVNEVADAYTMDVCNLSDGAVEALEEMGVNVKYENLDDVVAKMLKKDEDANTDAAVSREYYITCKSKNPIRVKDDVGNSLDDTAIGNGSDAVVTVGWYDWTFKNKEGRSPSARRVIINELVAYEGSVDDDDEPAL